MCASQIFLSLPFVAQVSNLPYRRLPVGRPFDIGRSADWKSATSPESFRGTQVGNLRYLPFGAARQKNLRCARPCSAHLDGTTADPSPRPSPHPMGRGSNTTLRLRARHL